MFTNFITASTHADTSEVIKYELADFNGRLSKINASIDDPLTAHLRRWPPHHTKLPVPKSPDPRLGRGLETRADQVDVGVQEPRMTENMPTAVRRKEHLNPDGGVPQTHLSGTKCLCPS